MSAGGASLTSLHAPLYAPATALPRPPTSLVGRESELARVRSLLDGGDTRLVTLTGPGGIGKTRLALAVAEAMEADFAHGARFVGFASVREPGLIPTATARALGLQESGDRSTADLVVSALHDRHLLLVLDNLEHIVEEASLWISELLERCPRLSIVATSRAPMQIAGERRFPVPPLALPDAPSTAPEEPMQPGAAVELFVQRAQAVRPDFELTADTVEIVNTISLALEGLPLAIELAAARLHVLSPGALLARLTDRLTILQGGTRDASVRHRTMRDTIAWSYDLLSPEQQALFRRLSVFTGGFTMEAAEAVGGGQALELVSDLVDHSLILPLPPEGGEDRYRMLEVIREYGLERLEAAGEAESARESHALWALALGRRFELDWDGPGQVDLLRRMEADHSNVRVALTWLIDRDRIEEAQDFLGSLMMFFSVRGYYAGSRGLYEELVAHPKGGRPTPGRAKALLGLGVVAAHQGDAERARVALEESVEIFRALDDRQRLSVSMECLGMALGYLGRFEESEAVTASQLDLSREIGYLPAIAGGLNNLSLSRARQERTNEARQMMRESVEIQREIGYTWGLALGLGNLGWFELVAGHLDEAEAYMLEAMALMRALASKRDLPMVLSDYAEVAKRRGDMEGARLRLTEALAIASDSGNWIGAAAALQGIADLQRSTGDLAEATSSMRRALESWLSVGNLGDGMSCLDSIADIAIASGDMAAAARLIGAADGIRERASQPRFDLLPGDHDRRLETIQRALDERSFQAEWGRGRAMSDEEAIAEALAWEPIAATVDSSSPAEPGPAADLTRRELEVLRLMAEGLSNQQIADQLFVSKRTATSHASNILAKLDLPSRTAAVAWALRNSIV